MQPNIVNPRLIYALINWVHLHQLVSCPGAHHLFCLMTRPIGQRSKHPAIPKTIEDRLWLLNVLKFKVKTLGMG